MAKYCNCDNFYNVEDFKNNIVVKFKELPIKLLREMGLVIDEEFTISSVLVRVNSLSEVSIVVELDKLPGRYFDPSILLARRVGETIPVKKEEEKTLMNLIRENNDLRSENSYLRNLLNHSLN